MAAIIPKNSFKCIDKIDVKDFLFNYGNVIMCEKEVVAKDTCSSAYFCRETVDISVKIHNRLNEHRHEQNLWLCAQLAD